MLEEAGVGAGEGYRFAVLGDHDAEVGPLVSQVRAIAEREVARQYLEPAEGRAGWSVADGDEVVGRLVSRADGPSWTPYDVVIDGRTLTWEEFGEALSSYEGWIFRLVIEDRVVEARSAGEVIDIRRPRSGPRRPQQPAP